MKKLIMFLTGLIFFLTAQSQPDPTSPWLLTGNTATNPSSTFLGTNDNQPLRLRVNNTPSGEINSAGKTAFGFGAGQGGAGTYSTAIGFRALNLNPGYQNTAVGSYALENSNSGSSNVAVGYGAMQLTTSGNSNTAIGYAAMVSTSTGYNNCGMGYSSLRSNSTGNYNTAIGNNALFSTTSAWYNTAIGYNAGVSYNLGYNNTIIGASSGGSFAGQYNIIAIGQGVTCPGNSTARIGNTATVSIGGYAGWSNFSDGRFKKDIKEEVKGLDFIMKLRPVTYHLNITALSKQLKENQGEEWNPQMKIAMAEKEQMLQTGFVAQEVEQAAAATGFDFSGLDKPKDATGFYALRYAEFVVPLVKAMQEQQQIIADLEARIIALEKKAGNNIPSFNSTADVFNVWPNPSHDMVFINIVSEKRSQAVIKIFDNKGTLIKQQQESVLQGGNMINIDIKELAGGIYQLSAEWNNGQIKKTASVLKQ